MAKLVGAFADIVANVRQFNADLDARTDLVTQLSFFRHWYYIQELDAFGRVSLLVISG